MGSNSELDPRSVANVMLAFATRRNIALTHVAIQKLVYFAHATYLVRHNRPLVSGYFEAWEHGPVHRVLYNSLKRYGRQAVSQPIECSDPFSGKTHLAEAITDLEVVDHIEEITRQLGHLPAGFLIELSHAKGGPWDHIWNKSKTEPVLGNRISDTVTKQLFSRIKTGVPLTPRSGDVDEASPVTDD